MAYAAPPLSTHYCIDVECVATGTDHNARSVAQVALVVSKEGPWSTVSHIAPSWGGRRAEMGRGAAPAAAAAAGDPMALRVGPVRPGRPWDRSPSARHGVAVARRAGGRVRNSEPTPACRTALFSFSFL